MCVIKRNIKIHGGINGISSKTRLFVLYTNKFVFKSKDYLKKLKKTKKIPKNYLLLKKKMVIYE